MLSFELDTYEAIEAAVKETARGRAFLAEHALRARQSDTAKVMAAIERLEQYWLSKNITNGQEEFRARSSELPLVRTGSIAEEVIEAGQDELGAGSSEPPLVRTGSITEEAIETTGAQVRNLGKRNQTLSDESILRDIAKALEAP